jgi:hypothetical protein
MTSRIQGVLRTMKLRHTNYTLQLQSDFNGEVRNSVWQCDDYSDLDDKAREIAAETGLMRINGTHSNLYVDPCKLDAMFKTDATDPITLESKPHIVLRGERFSETLLCVDENSCNRMFSILKAAMEHCHEKH